MSDADSPLLRAHATLAATARHPDAPSCTPLYLRALLELTVLREHREAARPAPRKAKAPRD